MSALLAGRLSALRTQRGFSQRQIANYIGISSQSCSHYETGPANAGYLYTSSFSGVLSRSYGISSVSRKGRSVPTAFSIDSYFIE